MQIPLDAAAVLTSLLAVMEQGFYISQIKFCKHSSTLIHGYTRAEGHEVKCFQN